MIWLREGKRNWQYSNPQWQVRYPASNRSPISLLTIVMLHIERWEILCIERSTRFIFTLLTLSSSYNTVICDRIACWSKGRMRWDPWILEGTRAQYTQRRAYCKRRDFMIRIIKCITLYCITLSHCRLSKLITSKSLILLGSSNIFLPLVHFPFSWRIVHSLHTWMRSREKKLGCYSQIYAFIVKLDNTWWASDLQTWHGNPRSESIQRISEEIKLLENLTIN